MRGNVRKGFGVVAAAACSLALVLGGGAAAFADDSTGGYTFKLGEPTGTVYTDLMVPKGFKPVDGGMVPRMPVTVGNLTVGKEYCVSVTDSGDGEGAWKDCARATATTQTYTPFMTVGSFHGGYDKDYADGKAYAHLFELGSSKTFGVSAAKLVKTSSVKNIASLSDLSVAPASNTSVKVAFNYAIDRSLDGKVAGMCVNASVDRGFTLDVLEPAGLGGVSGEPSYCDGGSSHSTGSAKIETRNISGNGKVFVKYTSQSSSRYEAYDFAKDLNANLSGTASLTLSDLVADTKYGNWGKDLAYWAQYEPAGTHIVNPWSFASANVQLKFLDGTYADAVSSANLPDFTTAHAGMAGAGTAGGGSSSSFKDVDAKTPHADDIKWLASTGISTGWKRADGSYEFRGMSSVKRQDMAAFLYRLAGRPKFDETKVRNPFRDVTSKTPHYKEIMWLYSTGISTGWKMADGSFEFRGMNAVVRQDMAAFLHRLADYEKAKPTLGKDVLFRDVTSSTPHRADIAWLAKTGVTTGWKEADGTTTFRGMSTVKRQDMAAFLHRMKLNVLK